VEEFVAPFRYTVYASRSGAGLPGRPSLLRDSFPEDTVFVDRSQGSLAALFSSWPEEELLDTVRVPVLFQFKLNVDYFSTIAKVDERDDKMVSVYLSPGVLTGLALLPNSPTMEDMLETINYYSRGDYAEKEIRELLLHNLDNLVRLGLVSVWSKPRSYVLHQMQ
jgi:hypothetical protein